MALLNIFKKKKEWKKKPVDNSAVSLARQNAELLAEKKPKKTSGISYRVLIGLRITERATDLIQKNQYIFEVYSEANKIEIKKAIEDIYGVDVVSVNIINIPRKKRRLGRVEGWRKGYKKAVVKIKEGQKIEVLPR